MRISRLALALGLAFVVSPAFAQNKVNLRPKFEKGQETRLKMDISNVMSMGGQGPMAGTEQKLKQEIGLVLKVKDSDPEKGATVELVYESLKFKAEAAGNVMEFDSAQPVQKDEESMLAPMMRPIIGATLTLLIDPQGNITSITGGENLVNQLTSEFLNASQVKSRFGTIISPKHGDGLASVGEAWTNEDTLESPMGKIITTTTHTLESAEGNSAKVSFKGTSAPDPTASAQIKLKSSLSSGTYVWDTAAGMLQEMTFDQDVSLETPQAPGQEIKAISKVVITRVK